MNQIDLIELRDVPQIQIKSKTPQLLDEMFKNLPFSVIGELIAVCCYINVVYFEQSIFIAPLLIIECSVLLIQLCVHLSYNIPGLRLPIDYRLAYLLTLPLSIFTLAAISLFYTFNNPHLILIAGMLYIAVTTGGSLFHCYIKYIHLFYIVCVFGCYAIACFLQEGIFIYIGVAAIIYAAIMIYASIQLNLYLTASCTLSSNQEEQLAKLSHYKELLNQKHKQLLFEHDKQKGLETELLKLNDKLIANKIDIQSQNEHRKSLLSLIYNSVEVIIFKTNQQKQITQYNEEFLRAFNIKDSAELLDFPRKFLTTIPLNNPLYRYFPYTTATLNNYISIRTTDNRYLECTVQLLKSPGGIENLWLIKDITEQVKQQNKLHHMINYDELTSLPNRISLQKKLTELSEIANNTNKLFALAFIDLNDFKIINDSLGHSMGNEILKLFANRLNDNIRPIDFAGRLGGDEFICIFNDLTYKSDVEPLIKKLKEGLEEPITINNNTLMINAGIGISFYPCDTLSIDELISFADIAMYRAKENRTDFYERYLPEYTQTINELHRVGQELKAALINNEFYLVFQPIYETKNHQIAKVEVLLRWRDHAPPNVFIPIAERLGLIHDIGLWVVSEACKARYELSQMAELSEEVKFCINISSQQLQTPKQIQELLTVVEQSSCKPSWLEFELTESTLVEFDKAVAFINTVKSMGISVAIDDFGTGFSSLSYLKNLYFDVIKIDKTFLSNIFEQPREMNIFLAIINLAQKLNVQITVEGVETKVEYDFCVDEHCHFIQGFYMSKPIDFPLLIEMLSYK